MKQDRHKLQRGFTLVEVMIATVVFSIGMMAVITMEYSALRAYSASRDLSVATGIASRTISLMKTESANWALNPLDYIDSAPPVHDSVGDAPVDINILREVRATPWTWLSVNNTPLNERMIKDGDLGRYCIFVRGDNSPLAVDPLLDPVVQAQVAVVYPTSNSDFVGADCAQIRCNGAVRLVSDLLEQPIGVTAGVLPELETCGMRAVYAGTLINR